MIASKSANPRRILGVSEENAGVRDQDEIGEKPAKNTRTVPLRLRTISTLNSREHWAQRAKRAKSHRRIAYHVVGNELDKVRRWFVPVAVKLTRVAPRTLDGDNLQGALKAVRDGVADALGIDDGDVSVTWSYDQQRGQPREYAVIVEVSDG